MKTLEKAKDPQEEINKLIALIREWDNAYYSGTKESPVSDAVYDVNKKLLKMLEKNFPQFALPDSPYGCRSPCG